MPNYIIIEVTGRNYREDTNDLRTALHSVIEEKCIRAGDIVLRDDRSTDSLGNDITRDYRNVGELYRRRAEMYRSARLERASRRGRSSARGTVNTEPGFPAAGGTRSGRVSGRIARPTADANGNVVEGRSADAPYDILNERDARLTFDLLTEINTAVRNVRRPYRDSNGRFARRPQPQPEQGPITINGSNVRAVRIEDQNIVASGGWCAPTEMTYTFDDYEVRPLRQRDLFVDDDAPQSLGETRRLPRHENGLLDASSLSTDELRRMFEPGGEEFMYEGTIMQMCTCCPEIPTPMMTRRS